MPDRGSLGQGTELLPIPSPHKSAYHLLQSASPKDSEQDPLQDSSHDEEHESYLKRSIFRDGARFEGWKFTVFLAFITSLVVLFFNIGLILYTATHSRHDDLELYPIEYQSEYSQGKHHIRNTVLYEGDCDTVHRLSTGFHLLVNLLSTALLSASNFGMQCLSAPTRRDIDKVHQSGRWLDIGVPSIRNIFRVSRRRSVLWLSLAFLSLPFHLMYNSAIYETTAVHAYDIFAGPASLPQMDWTDAHLTNIESHPQKKEKRESFRDLFYAAENETLDRLEPSECVDGFAQTFQKSYSKVLIVTDDVKGNDSYAFIYTNPVFNPYEYLVSRFGPYDWLCPVSLEHWKEYNCNVSSLPHIRSKITNNEWTVSGYKIDYCLAEKQEQHCKLQYSFTTTMIVIVFNIGKAGILFYMWVHIPDTDTPILTIGDAIASFLRRPDQYTQGGCLLAYRNVKRLHRVSPKALKKRPLEEARPFSEKRRRWGSALSRRRWIFSIFLWGIAIAVCICLLVYGLTQIGPGVNIWKEPLGTTVADTLITGAGWPNTLEPNVLIANAPQLIFSFLYFGFNGLLTTMTLAAEWSGYATHRKGLRVSNNAQSSQRSQYFLSIPYRYSMPLLATAVILHWLISQSLFMVGVEAFDSGMLRDIKADLITCGYSPVAIVSSTAVGGFMLFCLLGLSFKRFKTGMPVAGSCSLAISAACHPAFDPNENRVLRSDIGDEDMALLPIKWGVVAAPVDGHVGHCSFTSEYVDLPMKGKVYR
ncbi:hypothetical protein N7517_003912 [Penicillium concentricum]|uniref:DUF6536 domain-containing protein n=1 Tax=Penicillium concentricum TaxID=293559 RepID=A0A9W9VA63_9EURO|nr:uncharacterized protein N7517_003912 [Penicillium concentricum]KAJ5371906.1 hypothetical protein N7517_003912 [Penicillium concentricum]